MNKYFAPDIKNYPKVSESELKEAFALYEKYRALGLSYYKIIDALKKH